MQLNDTPGNAKKTTTPLVENLYGKENPTHLTSEKKILEAYSDAQKNLQVNDQKTDIQPTNVNTTEEKKAEKISVFGTEEHFESMQENEIGNPSHLSPIANLTSENSKKLNQQLSHEAVKTAQPLAAKKSDSTNIKREHEVGDPKKEKQTENPKADDSETEKDNTNTTETIREHKIGDPKKTDEKENPKSGDKVIKPTTEADNMDRTDTVREHEIGDQETIPKEVISAEESVKTTPDSNQSEDPKK